MAEILSAGVFIEEVPSGQNIVQAVSTSNLGAVGFTPRGPTDTATLITSFEGFQRVFGPDTRNSLVWKNVAAFYANGGRRLFMVRVVPSDSVMANGQIQSKTYNQQIETGVAAQALYTKTASTSQLKDHAGASTLVPGSFTATFRGTGTILTGDLAYARDGVTRLFGDGASLSYEGRITPYGHLVIGTTTAGVVFQSVYPGETGFATTIEFVDPSPAINQPLSVSVVGTAITVSLATDAVPVVTSTAAQVVTAVNAYPLASALVVASPLVAPGAGVCAAAAVAPLAGIPVISPPLDVVVSGTGVDVTVGWQATGPAAKTLVFLGSAVGPIVTATNVAGTSGTFDRRTGMFSLAIVTAELPIVDTFTVTHTPATPTSDLTSGSTVDSQGRVDLLGSALVAGGGIANASYLNVVDGSYSVTLTAATKFHPNGKMLCSYKINAWGIRPISNGVWGNDLRVDVSGSPNYYTASTQAYSRYDINVLMKDSLGNYVVMETYEELVFDDSTSSVYFPDVINELSDYITITEPGGEEAPGELNGRSLSLSVGGGDGTSAGKTFSFTLGSTPVGARSVTVTYTSAVDGLSYTITDDGNGAMTGSVDLSGTNSIEYTSGLVSFKTANAIKANTLVTVTYAVVAEEPTHTEWLGYTTKYYTFTVTSPVPYTYSFYTAGSDGTFTSSTFTRSQFTAPGLSGDFLGMYALSKIDEMMQVIIPDFAGDPVVSGDQLDYADSRAAQPCGGDRFIILTVPKGCNAQEAVDWFRYDFGRFSKFAALYWPWIKVADPLLNNRNLTMPGLGHVAGIYARTDTTRNVGKSPGGTVDGQLKFLTGLEYDPTQGDRDWVYPNKINPFISSAQTGLAVWGVRTIAIESEWRYINARRLFMFLEKSIYNSTFWIVFENNGPTLWAKIKSQINGFLKNLFAEGYFAGTSPSQAFFVICDESNNPQSSIDAGQVIIDIGVAPNKPAEFVRFRFTQKSL